MAPSGIRLIRNFVCLILFVCPSDFTTAAGGLAESPQFPAAPQKLSPAQRREELLKERQQQLSEEAGDIAGQIHDDLVRILTLLNNHSLPGKQTIEPAQNTLEQSKTLISRLHNNEMTCQYSMLDAWTSYFAGDFENAARSASRAYRTDSQDSDAAATQVAIAILTDTKFRLPRPAVRPVGQFQQMQEQPLPRRVNSRRQQQSIQPLNISVRPTDILDLELFTIRPDIIGNKITQFELQCPDSKKFSYQPENNILCLLLYDTGNSAVPADANNVSERPTQTPPVITQPAPPIARDRQEMSERPQMIMPYGPAAMSNQPGWPAAAETSVQQETAAFENLCRIASGHPDIKFLEINKLSPDQTVTAKDSSSNKSWPCAQITTDRFPPALQDLASVEAAQPVLVLADKTGTVKYAGQPSGFLAPLVLDKISQASLLSVEQFSQSFAAAEPNSIPTSQMPWAPADPNMLVSIISRLIRPKPADDENITEHPEYLQVQNQLEFARSVLIPSGRLPGPSSKRGVDTCREIIQKYPGTIYAEQARILLRQVPERERKLYNVTDEEMGITQPTR